MTAPRTPQRFLLLLRDADAKHPDAGPVIVRLRRAMKCLLRSFGLRCDRAEIFPSPPPGPLPEALGEGKSIEAETTQPT